MRERLVIDTNVIVSALRRGAPSYSKAYKLIHDVYASKYEVYVSSEIYAEYCDVLARKHLSIGYFNRLRWLWWVRHNAEFIEPRPSTQNVVEMWDEDDRVFFDVARCAKAKLVTRNLRHYPVDELRTQLDELY